MPVFFSSSIAKFIKNILVKFKYITRILIKALSYYKIAKIGLFDLWTEEVLERSISIAVGIFRAVIYTTKVFEFSFGAALANSFFSINLIWLVMDKASIAVYVL